MARLANRIQKSATAFSTTDSIMEEDAGATQITVNGDLEVTGAIIGGVGLIEAQDVAIADAGGLYVATDVEAALQEIADKDPVITINGEGSGTGTMTNLASTTITLTIADNIIDEANLKLDTGPTDNYILTADSSETGGMIWAQDLAGNAATASAWATGRTITLSGELAGVSPSWTGSANLAFSGTTVADNVIDEANLKLDTGPTNDYLLMAASSAGGGMKWASAAVTKTAIGIETGSGTFNTTADTATTITHSLGTANFRCIIVPTADANGYLGEYWVTKTSTNFSVYKTGTAASITFDYLLITY